MVSFFFFFSFLVFQVSMCSRWHQRRNPYFLITSSLSFGYPVKQIIIHGGDRCLRSWGHKAWISTSKWGSDWGYIACLVILYFKFNVCQSQAKTKCYFPKGPSSQTREISFHKLPWKKRPTDSVLLTIIHHLFLINLFRFCLHDPCEI